MNRFECAELVKQKLTAKDIVVCGLGSVEAAYKQVGPAGPTYFASDPMGIWPSVALGLALARPERRVVLLAGDGDLAMNMEVLVTIASIELHNLYIILFQNGSYASSGGQPLGGADKLSFAMIARGSGFTWAEETRTVDETKSALDTLFARRAVGFLAVHVDRDISAGEPAGPLSQGEERAAFMRAIES
jgi:thiamine pyrophosphate-dependent acetolactate synthase large subunit-like protein